MDLRQIAGLLIFFIFYVVAGGGVFMVLESQSNTKVDYNEKFNYFKEKLSNVNLTDSDKDILKDAALNLLGDQLEVYSDKWGFFNSFFFAITIVTTIGYGHLSPSTNAGRIFCILYAILGIPMTGILLGAIGDRFSRCFIDKVNTLKTRKRLSRLTILRHAFLFFVPWFIVFLVIPAIIFMWCEEWEFLDSFYYCFITLSTIGFGDYVIGQFDKKYVWLYKIGAALWIIFGLAYLSMILNFISRAFRSYQLRTVVHSFRRISGPATSTRLRDMIDKHKRSKETQRQTSYPGTLSNGKPAASSDEPIIVPCSTSLPTTPERRAVIIQLSNKKTRENIHSNVASLWANNITFEANNTIQRY